MGNDVRLPPDSNTKRLAIPWQLPWFWLRLSVRTMILKYIDHNRMQFIILCPDSVIDVSRPENSIACPDLACFTHGATDTYRSLTVNDQEQDRMVCRMFLDRGMRIKVHCLHLQFSVQ